jgi:hypothetical protein
MSADASWVENQVVTEKALHAWIAKVADQTNNEIDAWLVPFFIAFGLCCRKFSFSFFFFFFFLKNTREEQETQNATRLARASLGLKAALGVIKLATTEELKKGLAEALREIKQSPAAPHSLAPELGNADQSKLDSISEVLNSKGGPGGAMEEAWAEGVRALLTAANTVLQTRHQVNAAHKQLDGVQLDAAERSLRTVVVLLKESGSLEQKKALAEAFKSLPKEIPEDSATADRVMEWRKIVRRCLSCARPDALSLQKAGERPSIVAVSPHHKSVNPQARISRSQSGALPSSAVASVSISSTASSSSPPVVPKRMEAKPEPRNDDDDLLPTEVAAEEVGFAEAFDGGSPPPPKLMVRRLFLTLSFLQLKQYHN